MARFSAPENHPTIRGLCRDWEDMFRLPFARDGALLALAILPLLFIADLLIVAPEHYHYFMEIRAPVAALFMFNAGFIHWALKSKSLSVRSRRLIGRWGHLSPLLALLACYTYYLFLPLPQYRSAVVLAHMVIAFFGPLMLHRFWREQYLFSAISLVLYATLATIFPDMWIEFMSLINTELMALITMFYLRREFFGTMHIRFHNLCMFLPRAVARLAAVSHSSIDLTEAFKPQRRFAVCLCADWRDFQQLAATRSPEFLSLAFEKFYDVVLHKLDNICPDGGYYADWNADELFIVFYSEPNDAQRPVEQAFAMAAALGKDIFEQARRECGFELIYDIGMSSGFGLIGLMGPRNRKKTTVTAEAAGMSKRLETEAKLFRRQQKDQNPYPVLAIEEDLKALAGDAPAFKAANFLPVIATSKDIAQRTCYVWQVGRKQALDRSS